MRRVLVVGAGLAGLSAAIALARRGVAVTVATLDDRAEGTSITITNRAVDAVEALGLLDACLAHGLYPSGPDSIFAAMMDSAGNPLPVPPAPPRPDSRLPGWIAIYRPDLARIMREAARAAGVRMRTDTSFSALADEGAHVDVTFTDGTRDRFDLVIGADGSHSAIRRVIHPEIAPTYTGTMSFAWFWRTARRARQASTARQAAPANWRRCDCPATGSISRRASRWRIGASMSPRRQRCSTRCWLLTPRR